MNLADTPSTWPDPPPMSTLHALLLFGGVPLLIIAVLTLLVMAPSLARGPRYRPGQRWDAEPEWFGAREAEGAEAEEAEAQRGAATPSGRREDTDTGGASARW